MTSIKKRTLHMEYECRRLLLGVYSNSRALDVLKSHPGMREPGILPSLGPIDEVTEGAIQEELTQKERP